MRSPPDSATPQFTGARTTEGLFSSLEPFAPKSTVNIHVLAAVPRPNLGGRGASPVNLRQCGKSDLADMGFSANGFGGVNGRRRHGLRPDDGPVKRRASPALLLGTVLAQQK